jgi:MOSC domain-containing protein YiiM
VPLNHLVGRYFLIGDVLLFGGRLNTPCKYLDGLLGKELFQLLPNRSGLNCRIIRGGAIAGGARIRPAD